MVEHFQVIKMWFKTKIESLWNVLILLIKKKRINKIRDRRTLSKHVTLSNSVLKKNNLKHSCITAFLIFKFLINYLIDLMIKFNIVYNKSLSLSLILLHFAKKNKCKIIFWNILISSASSFFFLPPLHRKRTNNNH